MEKEIVQHDQASVVFLRILVPYKGHTEWNLYYNPVYFQGIVVIGIANSNQAITWNRIQFYKHKDYYRYLWSIIIPNIFTLLFILLGDSKRDIISILFQWNFNSRRIMKLKHFSMS